MIEKDYGIAGFSNLVGLDAPISQKDMVDHLKYWTLSQIKYTLDHAEESEVEGIENNMKMYEVFEILIKNRRKFYGQDLEDNFNE